MQGTSMTQLFIAGGPVMYPIVLLSVVMLAVTIEKVIVVFRQRIRIQPEKYLNSFLDAFEKNNMDKIKTLDEMEVFAKKKRSMCSDFLLNIAQKYRVGVTKNLDPLEMKQWMTLAVEQQASIELPGLEVRLTALAVISNVSTLVGLFGTVVGMIEAFTAMANAPGGVKADEMAGGIAVALVATAGGLCVAVPSLLLYNIIKGSIENFVSEVEAFTIKVIDTLVE